MINKTFKWKHWYWHCALASNIFTTLFLAIRVVLQKKNVFGTQDMWSWIMLTISSSIVMAFFIIYVYKTTKETKFCGTLIKPERFKFFQWGCLSSFVMFNVYLILWFISYKVNSEIPIYIAIPLTMFSGITSTILLTIYEFCVSFDIFYQRNKTEIVHDFLKKQMEIKEIKVVEEENL